MRGGAVDDANRDAGVEYVVAEEEAHPRTEVTHGDTPHGEDTHGTAGARTTSRGARARTVAEAQGMGRTQAAGT